LCQSLGVTAVPYRSGEEEFGRMRIEGTLKEIANHLEAKLEVLRTSGDEYVIIETGSHYTQLLCNVDMIYGEMVSNVYLATMPDGAVLTAAEEDRLVRLGWDLPGTACHSLCESAHDNFHRTWPADMPTCDVVRDMLLPLLTVGAHGEGDRFALIWDRRQTKPSTGLPTSH
jgi:hypothetical protein